MAILHSGSGLITAATTIQSFQGTIELQFSQTGRANKLVHVNSDKLAKNDDFTIQATGTVSGVTFDGWRLLGGSVAISAAAATTGSKLITSFFNQGSTAVETVDNGFGKVDFETSSTENNIKDVSVLHGLAIDFDNLSVEQGAVIFARTTGTAVSAVEAGTATTADEFFGGTGTALVSSTAATPAFNDYVIRLDEINYPFTTVAGDNVSIEPIGSSLLFV